MGVHYMMAECNDCEKTEIGDLTELKLDNDQFWVKMEHMDKSELMQHLNDVVCPECGSNDWTLSDLSMFSGQIRTPGVVDSDEKGEQ